MILLISTDNKIEIQKNLYKKKIVLIQICAVLYHYSRDKNVLANYSVKLFSTLTFWRRTFFFKF